MKMEPSELFASTCTETQVIQSENQALQSTDDPVPTRELAADNGIPVSTKDQQGTLKDLESQTPGAAEHNDLEITDTAKNNDPAVADSTCTTDKAGDLPPTQPGSATSSLLLKQLHQISGAFLEVLKIPKAKQSSSKNKFKRPALPKAISGQKFHDLLEQRKQKKEEENAQKEARKLQREQKKKEREEQLQQKQKEKEEKKLQKEQKKKSLKRKKEVEKMLKELQKKRKSQESESDSTDKENEHLDISLEDDDMIDHETSFSKSCYSCGQPFDGKAEYWIACHNCPRWLHRACVKTETY